MTYSDQDPPIDVNVFLTLHWDREWFLPFESMRWRLIAAMDNILDVLSTQSDLPQFVLDGQLLILRDYFDIRPERLEVVRKLIAAEKMIIGPLFTQSDLFLCSEESIIRNFLVAREYVRNILGTEEDRELAFLPDACGAIGQLPQICRIFGIDGVVLTRGIDSEIFASKSLVQWSSGPDSSVGLVHLKGGYGSANSNFLMRDYGVETIANRISDIKVQGEFEWHALAINCEGPINDIAKRLAKIESMVPGNVRLRRDGWSQILMKVIESNSMPKAPPYIGSLVSNGETILHADAHTYRSRQKDAHHQSQQRLELVAEFLGAYDAARRNRSNRAFLDHAWDLSLQNHSEDTLRGCIVDGASRKAATRSADVVDICDSIIQSALDNPQFVTLESRANQIAVRVWNCGPSQTNVLIEAEVPLPVTWAAALQTKQWAVDMSSPRQILVVAAEQVESEVAVVRPLMRPTFGRRQVWKSTVLISEVPSFGYTTLILKLIRSADKNTLRAAGQMTTPIETLFTPVRKVTSGAESELRSPLTVELDGSISLSDALGFAENNYSIQIVVFPDHGDAYSTDSGEQSGFISEPFPASNHLLSHLIHSTDEFFQATVSGWIGIYRRCDNGETTAERIEVEFLFTLAKRENVVRVRMGCQNIPPNARLSLRLTTPSEVNEMIVGEPYGSRRVTRVEGSAEVRDEREAMDQPAIVSKFFSVTCVNQTLAFLTAYPRAVRFGTDCRNSMLVDLHRTVGRINGGSLGRRRKSLAPGEFKSEEGREPGCHSWEFGLCLSDSSLTLSELRRTSDRLRKTVITSPPLEYYPDIEEATEFSLLSANSKDVQILYVGEGNETTSLSFRLFNTASRIVEAEVTFGVPIHDCFKSDVFALQRLSALVMIDDTTLIIQLHPFEILTCVVHVATSDRNSEGFANERASIN